MKYSFSDWKIQEECDGLNEIAKTKSSAGKTSRSVKL
jgi:hypothetical protein